jgi:predicted RNase H-like nuclease (RuvC/YqgF family)
MDSNSWVPIVAVLGGLLSVAAILGAMAVVFRGAYSKASQEALRQDLVDSKEREKTRADQLREAEGRITELEAKVEGLERENSYLRDIPSNIEAINKLTREMKVLVRVMNMHHKESLGAWAAIQEAVGHEPN